MISKEYLFTDFFFMILSSSDFFQNNFFKKIFQEYHHSAKQLDPDLAGSSVGPDLGQNCFHRLSVEDKRYHLQLISLPPSATYLEFCAVKLYSPLALPCI